MQIYVYILRCADGSYYVGLTRDGLDKRIAEHADGRFAGYTYARRPVTLAWSQDFSMADGCRRLRATLERLAPGKEGGADPGGLQGSTEPGENREASPSFDKLRMRTNAAVFHSSP